MKRFFPALVAVSMLAACGGDSSTNPVDDGNGNNGGPGEGAGRGVKADPSFAEDIQEIFDRRGCSSGSCHGVSEAAGLRLSSGNSYAELVGVGATQGGTRVIAGDAQNSYLIVKVENRQTVGGRMPPSGAALDTIDINNLRNWINAGAESN